MSNEALVLLSPVCAVKPELCQWAFPLLVHDMLAGGRDDYREKLSTEVDGICIFTLFMYINLYIMGTVLVEASKSRMYVLYSCIHSILLRYMYTILLHV